MKTTFAVLSLALLAGASWAQSQSPRLPLEAMSRAEAAPKSSLNEESSQRDWESQVDRLHDLKLKVSLKSHENLALRALLGRDYAAAGREFQKVLDMTPNDSDPAVMQDWLYLADARSMADSDPRGARQGYDQLIVRLRQWLASSQNPESRAAGARMLARAYASRGVAAMRAGMNGSVDPEALSQALQDMDEALKVGHPKPSLLIWEKSQILAALQRYPEAAQAYEAALKLEPGRKDAPSHEILCKNFADHGLAVGGCN